MDEAKSLTKLAHILLAFVFNLVRGNICIERSKALLGLFELLVYLFHHEDVPLIIPYHCDALKDLHQHTEAFLFASSPVTLHLVGKFFVLEDPPGEGVAYAVPSIPV